MGIEPKTLKEYEQALRYCDNRIKQLTGELNKHVQEEHELRWGLAKKVASSEIHIDDPVHRFVLSQGNNFIPYPDLIEEFYRGIDQKIRKSQNKLVLLVGGSEHDDCTGRGTTYFQYDDFFLGILNGDGLIFKHVRQDYLQKVFLPTTRYVCRHGSMIAPIEVRSRPLGGHDIVNLDIHNFIKFQGIKPKIIPLDERSVELIIGKRQINKWINEGQHPSNYRRMIDEMTKKLLELPLQGP